MNKMQMKGVAEILKKRFPNLSAAETMGIIYDVVEVVLNQATKDQFANWFKEERNSKLDRIDNVLNNIHLNDSSKIATIIQIVKEQ